MWYRAIRWDLLAATRAKTRRIADGRATTQWQKSRRRSQSRRRRLAGRKPYRDETWRLVSRHADRFVGIGPGVGAAIAIAFGWGCHDYVANNMNRWAGNARNQASSMSTQSSDTGGSPTGDDG